MTVPVSASEGSPPVDASGASSVGVDSEDVIVVPGVSVVAGTEEGVDTEVAVELPPHAANRNTPAISAIPNIQKRFIFTKVPPRFFNRCTHQSAAYALPPGTQNAHFGRSTNITGQYRYG